VFNNNLIVAATESICCLSAYRPLKRIQMPENPLEVIRSADPEFFGLLETTRENALSEGAIPLKYKLLIAMSLDAAAGAVERVRILAIQAMDNGSTKEEITEALRIAQYIAGIGSVYTAANALKDIL
jgi:alkylhydroperoxidase/carboxymuconolactone decarboxylase family protein YurZ